MSRQFAAPLVLAFVGLIAAATSTAANWTDTAFPIKNHNFGTVAVAAKTEFRFPIHNTLSTPMHIQSVRTSCGCTTAIIETQSIPPGESGSILARFNTGTFRGQKGATITVVISQPFYTEVRLRVDGYIRSDMVFHPGAIEFGNVEQGQPKSVTSRILYAGRDDWKVVDVQSNQPWLTPSLTQVTRGGGRVEYDLAVGIREDAPSGFFQDEILIVTNDRSMPRVPLRVTGQVDSVLSISPQAIALGSLKPGQSVEKKLVIRGREPFTIAAIECPGWEVEMDPTLEPKSTHIITARFTPIEGHGHQRVSFQIKTAGESSLVAHALLTAEIRSE